MFRCSLAFLNKKKYFRKVYFIANWIPTQGQSSQKWSDLVTCDHLWSSVAFNLFTPRSPWSWYGGVALPPRTVVVSTTAGGENGWTHASTPKVMNAVRPCSMALSGVFRKGERNRPHPLPCHVRRIFKSWQNSVPPQQTPILHNLPRNFSPTPPSPMAYHNTDAGLHFPSSPVHRRLDDSAPPSPQVGHPTTLRTIRYGEDHRSFLRRATFDTHDLDPVSEAVLSTSVRKTRYSATPPFEWCSMPRTTDPVAEAAAPPPEPLRVRYGEHYHNLHVE